MENTIDQGNCDKEPVAFINQIQSFGAMIVLDKHLNVAQVSENIEEWLALPSSEVIGKSVSEFFGVRQIEAITAFASSLNSRALMPIGVIGKQGANRANAIAHSTEGYVVLELEPWDEETDARSADLASAGLKNCIESMSATSSLSTFCDTLAECVRSLTGFDRVMVYRFHEDWHGEVVAEARIDDVESYLGNHFPASDIPEPARKLFAAGWVRVISDVQKSPYDLVPTYAAGRSRPVNLTMSSLRQASPVHIEYLKNMNVGASLTISLLLNGSLWGLVACHNRKAKYMNYWMRSTCEFVGKFASEHLKGVISAESEDLVKRFSELGLQIVDDPRKLNMEAICTEAAELFHASNVVFVSDAGKIQGGRNRVSDVDLMALHGWLKNERKSKLHFTNRLGDNLQVFSKHQALASGLIAARMFDGYLLIFRPEYLQVLTYAGNPEKAVQPGSDRLHPRVSFAAWKQEVQGQSKRWTDAEVVSAQSLASLLDASIQSDENDYALAPVIQGSLTQSIKVIDDLADDELISPLLLSKLQTMRSRLADVLELLEAQGP